MKIQIPDLPEGLLHREAQYEALHVFTDPEERCAVAELAAGELFVALRILSREGEDLRGSYVDHYRYDDAELPALRKFTVLWDQMDFGFCKLDLWDPEGPVQRDGGFHRTVKRFYFDRELYEASREERRRLL